MGNSHAANFATHHDGIIRSMSTARRAEADCTALHTGIMNMRLELSANDAEIKGAMSKLKEQDDILVTAARSLSDDQLFVKNVIEQVTATATAQSAGELKELNKNVRQLPPILADHLTRLEALEKSARAEPGLSITRDLVAAATLSSDEPLCGGVERTGPGSSSGTSGGVPGPHSGPTEFSAFVFDPTHLAGTRPLGIVPKQFNAAGDPW